jgi:hypothetical protein
MRALLCLLALAGTLFAAPVSADFRITFDRGGEPDRFLEKYRAIRDMAGMVIIDGQCMSSCTLLAGVIPDERICVTSRAVMAFHSVMHFDYKTGHTSHAVNETLVMWHTYPVKLRELLKSKGWDGAGESAEHRTLIFIEGDELRTLFQECKE